MIDQLPALQVVLPLIAAPLSVVVNRAGFAWLVAVLVSIAGFACSAGLLVQTLDEGTIRYALGGWAAPWGIEYRIDALNAYVLIVVSSINVVALAFARHSVASEIEESRRTMFYAGWLLCYTGLAGILITGDAFNVFVFLEIASLSSYLLVSLGPDRRALRAAFRYLVLGTIGATFLLIGIGLLYGMTGTLNMIDLAARIPGVAHTGAVSAAFAFITVGIGLKMAIFPLHLWLPNAYSHAPSAVSVLLAATSTKVAVYLLVRFWFDVFGASFSIDEVAAGSALTGLALVGIVTGSVLAVFQDDAKRLLAWSSVAQIGYMALGIGLASVVGVMAGLLHVFNHALMKCALFMALGCVVYRTGTVLIHRLPGIARTMPWTMAAFVAAGLSLIGVPSTAGFISKWYLILAAIEGDAVWIAALVLASSLISVIYVWRVVEVAYLRPPSETSARAREAPAWLLVPTWTMVAANVYFGLETSVSTGVARTAAAALIGGPG